MQTRLQSGAISKESLSKRNYDKQDDDDGETDTTKRRPHWAATFRCFYKELITHFRWYKRPFEHTGFHFNIDPDRNRIAIVFTAVKRGRERCIDFAVMTDPDIQIRYRKGTPQFCLRCPTGAIMALMGVMDVWQKDRLIDCYVTREGLTFQGFQREDQKWGQTVAPPTKRVSRSVKGSPCMRNKIPEETEQGYAMQKRQQNFMESFFIKKSPSASVTPSPQPPPTAPNPAKKQTDIAGSDGPCCHEDKGERTAESDGRSCEDKGLRRYLTIRNVRPPEQVVMDYRSPEPRSGLGRGSSSSVSLPPAEPLVDSPPRPRSHDGQHFQIGRPSAATETQQRPTGQPKETMSTLHRYMRKSVDMAPATNTERVDVEMADCGEQDKATPTALTSTMPAVVEVEMKPPDEPPKDADDDNNAPLPARKAESVRRRRRGAAQEKQDPHLSWQQDIMKQFFCSKSSSSSTVDK